MHGIRLFTIPIYSRDPEKHVCAERGRKAKFLSEIIRPAAPEDGAEWEHRYDQWYFMPWPYSQMIGAVEIRLNHFGDMKAFYWFVDAKRITDRMRNKKYQYAGKLADVSRIGNPNEQIRADIRRFIEILPRLRNRFRDRYFDTNDLDRLLDSINFGSIRIER